MKKPPFRVEVLFGTRPEAIKLATVIRSLRAHPDIECSVCVTGQHREMLDQVLKVFELVPDHNLGLMRPNQTLADFTGRALQAIDDHWNQQRPDFLIVQGDTTTTLAAAMAAFYRQIPVGHVEAGLRTHDIRSPWPEEFNRVVTTRIASLHFAPTETNRRNLLVEGVRDDAVFVTGNTVIDALLHASDAVANQPPPASLPPQLFDGGRRLVLITGHRRESFGAGFEAICKAIAELARRFPDTLFVYAVHMNPNVREPVNRILADAHLPNLYLLEPQPYLEFVALLRRSTLVLSDSGGVQEEAPSLGKPVLVMRDNTERPEGVEAGTVLLVGTRQEQIVEQTTVLLTDTARRNAMAHAHNPYGDGRASARIADRVLEYLLRQQA